MTTDTQIGTPEESTEPTVKPVEEMTDRELLIEMVTTCRVLAESFGTMAANPMFSKLTKMFGG